MTLNIWTAVYINTRVKYCYLQSCGNLSPNPFRTAFISQQGCLRPSKQRATPVEPDQWSVQCRILPLRVASEEQCGKNGRSSYWNAPNCAMSEQGAWSNLFCAQLVPSFCPEARILTALISLSQQEWLQTPVQSTVSLPWCF